MTKDIPRSVTVEICSACNRRCVWCPQSKFHRSMVYLPLPIIEKVATDLAEIGYTSGFGLHHFNEPLLDNRLPQIIRLVKAILPQSEVYIHTNGDCLTLDKWHELRSAGLGQAQVNQYDGCVSQPIADLHAALSEEEKQRFKLRVFGRRNIGNRAGLIHTRRTLPIKGRCKRIWQACINYEGSLVLCCNDYNGVVNVGNVADDSIVNIFNHPRLVHYRKTLETGNREGLELCDRCDMRTRGK